MLTGRRGHCPPRDTDRGRPNAGPSKSPGLGRDAPWKQSPEPLTLCERRRRCPDRKSGGGGPERSQHGVGAATARAWRFQHRAQSKSTGPPSRAFTRPQCSGRQEGGVVSSVSTGLMGTRGPPAGVHEWQSPQAPGDTQPPHPRKSLWPDTQQRSSAGSREPGCGSSASHREAAPKPCAGPRDELAPGQHGAAVHGGQGGGARGVTGTTFIQEWMTS